MKKLSNQFIVIVSVYNNPELIKTSLQSVFDQNYEDFGVIIRDDMSTDETPHVIQNILGIDGLNNTYVKFKDIDVLYIINTKKMYGGGNTYDSVINFTNNLESIIGVVDGDDMLINTNALKTISEIYFHRNVWQVWSQHQAKSLYFSEIKGFSDFLPENKFIYLSRQYWSVSHFRTCKAWLFFVLDKSDLLDPIDNESYYKYCADAAFIYPITELCGYEKSFFLNKILYLYNDDLQSNEYNKAKEDVEIYSEYIKSKKIYKQITEIPNFTINH